ncbi:unnamed protein product, partial [Mesorhabditis belari]|uniref:Uncharacterized protein n=1 Tax=Mesorhabditis belari TaxID=2138241 RepID=A0AAF3J8A1_9BILA
MFSSSGCLFCDLLYIIPLITAFYFLRQYIRGGQFKENVRANGKIAVVTGANSGVGRALCEELNKRGAKVYMLCRDEKRAAQAREQLVENGCNDSNLLIQTVDLADFSSIRDVVKILLTEESHIDILINNAGLLGIPQFEKTKDGVEKTWQSNYLGHFLLTELLLSSLEKSSDPRIVNVSSIVHPLADSIDLDYVNNPKNYGRMKAYSRSKLANIMHSRELSTRYPKIKSSSCHPGNINSNILSTSGWIFLKDIFAPIFWFCFKTEMDGAQTPLHLALSQHLKGNGLYYSDCVVVEESEKARFDGDCVKLYEQSRQVVHKWL